MSRRTATDLFRRTLPLRKYQIPHFNQLLGHIREHVAGRGEGTALGYEAPMGSGKTTTIKALASLLLCGDLRLVVVAAPLDAIVEQWAQPGSWRTEAGECLTLPTLHRDAPRATAVDLRDPKWWATASGFYVTTRQAMCTKRGLDALAASRASLRRVLVVGDEGHHHGDGTLAGKFFEALRGRGAATLLVLVLLFGSLSRQIGRREALMADLRSSEARLLDRRAQRKGCRDLAAAADAAGGQNRHTG